MCISLSLSLSLSLCIYIYIYIYIHTHIHTLDVHGRTLPSPSTVWCLKKHCARLTPTGKQVLKRICKGKTTYGLKSWPDEGYSLLAYKGALACTSDV